jgi:hypothetical protein
VFDQVLVLVVHSGIHRIIPARGVWEETIEPRRHDSSQNGGRPTSMIWSWCPNFFFLQFASRCVKVGLSLLCLVGWDLMKKKLVTSVCCVLLVNFPSLASAGVIALTSVGLRIVRRDACRRLSPGQLVPFQVQLSVHLEFPAVRGIHHFHTRLHMLLSISYSESRRRTNALNRCLGFVKCDVVDSIKLESVSLC